jgi:hypothetical protein
MDDLNNSNGCVKVWECNVYKWSMGIGDNKVHIGKVYKGDTTLYGSSVNMNISHRFKRYKYNTWM